MITEARTSKGSAAITSDQWHVVLSRLLFAGAVRPFSRGIHSEHPDRRSCGKAARLLRERIARDSHGLPDDQRDEVFVRRPNFKSLKRARGRKKPGV